MARLIFRAASALSAALFAVPLLAGASPSGAAPSSGSFSISASTGRAGYEPLLRSRTPCPTEGGTAPNVVVSTSLSRDLDGRPAKPDIWPADDEDGAWAALVRSTERARPGRYRVRVACTLIVDGARVRTLSYRSTTFTVARPGLRVKASTRYVDQGKTFTAHVACPKGTTPRVYARRLWDDHWYSPTSKSSHRDTWKATFLTGDATGLPKGNYVVEAYCEDALEPEPAVPGFGFLHSSPVVVGPLWAVAMGDSYSSGEGNPPWDPGTNRSRPFSKDMCHRSKVAWPRLLGVPRARHLACSGAKLVDVIETGKANHPPDNVPQVTRIAKVGSKLPEGAHLDVVTLTIGGNDIGFSTILRTCVLTKCLLHPRRVEKAIDDLQEPLERGLSIIQAAAPHSRVVLVGYPRLFPRKQSSTVRCGWLDHGERVRANKLAMYLTRMQRRAAETAGASFVDVSNAMNGHELCTKQSWVVAIRAIDAFDQTQGHPTRRGQAAITHLVRSRIGRLS